MRVVLSTVAFLLTGLLITGALAQDRKTKVLNDRQKVETAGFWIYNDLAKGFQTAQRTGKPLLVVFRCIPCEHCAQLDERTVERDASIQKVLEQFVCVRIVHANGMDLSLFQFDYDQSWAAFFLNADQTIYGRYGTRSHQTESADDVSLEGFRAALEGALALHREFPRNRPALAKKRGGPPPVATPEEFPSLKGRYRSRLDYEGQVVQSCIHCHQVGEAVRMTYRTGARPMPEDVLFPYPNPRALGLQMDPATRSTVKAVLPGSPGATGGFQAGDRIQALEGQPILSTADIQWVLHHAGTAASLEAEVGRGARTLRLRLPLPAGWRRRDDISWRATSWDLRRMTLGGLRLETAPSEQLRAAGLGAGPALLVRHVGEYGEHAVAKRAGFQRGDLILKVNGQPAPETESLLLAQLAERTRPGEDVRFEVQRGATRLNLAFRTQ